MFVWGQVYFIKSSLTIVSNHSGTVNTDGLRLYGDEVGQSTIIAGAPMDAVLR